MLDKQREIREYCKEKDMSEFLGLACFLRGYEMYRQKHGSVKHLMNTDSKEYEIQMDRRLDVSYRYAKMISHYCHRNDIKSIDLLVSND